MTLLSRRRFLMLVGGTALAGCTATAPSTKVKMPGRPDSPLAANAALGVWPSKILSLPTQVRDAYAYAATLPRSLRYIPCYCGCGSAGHQDNLACYVQSTASDGWVVLDMHAAGCGTCVGITQDVVKMEKAGRPLREMRRAIDERWASAGPSTPTPLPD